MLHNYHITLSILGRLILRLFYTSAGLYTTDRLVRRPLWDGRANASVEPKSNHWSNNVEWWVGKGRTMGRIGLIFRSNKVKIFKVTICFIEKYSKKTRIESITSSRVFWAIFIFVKLFAMSWKFWDVRLLRLKTIAFRTIIAYINPKNLKDIIAAKTFYSTDTLNFFLNFFSKHCNF